MADDDDEAPILLPRRPGRPRKTTTTNEDETTTTAEAIPITSWTPYQLINERKRAAARDKKLSDEEIIDQFNDYYNLQANAGRCVQISNGRHLNCNCLAILKDNQARQAVSRFALDFGEKEHNDRINTAIGWYRYAKPSNNNKSLLIPFNSAGNVQVNKLLQDKKICINALCKICGFGQRQWKTIRDSAEKGIMATKHGLAGKAGNRKRKTTNPIIEALHKHFQELLGLSEV